MNYFRNTRDPVATLASVTEKRWENIEAQLKSLQKKVSQLCQLKGLSLESTLGGNQSTDGKFKDIVIEMDPKHPCQSLVYLAKKMSQSLKILFTQHIHSSIQNRAEIPQDFWPTSNPQTPRLEHNMAMTLIWKSNGLLPILKSSTGKKIMGEPNLLRYLARLTKDTQIYPETSSEVHWIDAQLDTLYEMSTTDKQSRTILAKNYVKSTKRPDSLKSTITLADLYFQSLVLKEAPDLKPLNSIFISVKTLL